MSYSQLRINTQFLVNPITLVLTTVLLILWLLISQSVKSSWAKTEHLLPSSLVDHGIFPDLDSQVRVPLPTWLSADLLKLATWEIKSTERHGVNDRLLGLFYDDQLLNIFQVRESGLNPKDQERLFKLSSNLTFESAKPLPKRYAQQYDRDRDGIFDLLDLYRGAIKTRLNAADYQEGYERLKYPLGDVSREIGVCTDVVIRAYRNAGWDLQKLIYKDMIKRPKAYGLRGKRPNRNIDHRRVRRQIVYFKKHYKSLPIKFDSKQRGEDAWLPGDIIFMDTLDKGRPTHVGLVSASLGSDGEPLIINNWTYGYKTSEMSLRGIATYMYRFRITLPK